MTTLEDLLADIAANAKDPTLLGKGAPSPARTAPPTLIEVSDLDVVEERPIPATPPPRRLARGTEAAPADGPGFIDMRSMGWTYLAERSSKIAGQTRRYQVVAVVAVLLALGTGGVLAWNLLAGRSQPASAPTETPVAAAPVAVADPIEQPQPVPEPVILDEEAIAPEPADEESFPPLFVAPPRAPAAAAPPAPLSLAGPCYEAACAALDDAAGEEEVAEDDRDSLPARPHASAIANAVVGIQDQLDGCGDAFGTHGAVRLKLRIGPKGDVESVVVRDGSANFRTCVGDAVRRVRVHASAIGTTETFAVRVR